MSGGKDRVSLEQVPLSGMAVPEPRDILKTCPANILKT